MKESVPACHKEFVVPCVTLGALQLCRRPRLLQVCIAYSADRTANTKPLNLDGFKKIDEISDSFVTQGIKEKGRGRNRSLSQNSHLPVRIPSLDVALYSITMAAKLGYFGTGYFFTIKRCSLHFFKVLLLGVVSALPEQERNPDVSGSAWGPLKPDAEYVDGGEVEEIDGLPVYRYRIVCP